MTKNLPGGVEVDIALQNIFKYAHKYLWIQKTIILSNQNV